MTQTEQPGNNNHFGVWRHADSELCRGGDIHATRRRYIQMAQVAVRVEGRGRSSAYPTQTHHNPCTSDEVGEDIGSSFDAAVEFIGMDMYHVHTHAQSVARHCRVARFTATESHTARRLLCP